MTIEVRQMLIRSVVDDRPADARPQLPVAAGLQPQELQRLRTQLLAECRNECRRWLAEQQRTRAER
jgi:hypothetical protein